MSDETKFADVVQLLSRRRALQGGLGASALAFFGCKSDDAKPAAPPMEFTPVPASRTDAVVVPPEYSYEVVNRWGDPILPGAPDFKQDATGTAADQAMQAGSHDDGMEFFPARPPGTTG
jgi:secreted PhoX family phosphatase